MSEEKEKSVEKSVEKPVDQLQENKFPEESLDQERLDQEKLDQERLDHLVDFIFEAGWLKKTPRSGWLYLGQGKEDVAQHSFRTAILSYTLAKMAGADAKHAAMLALFHDLHEARTSDLNYMNQRYVTRDERRAQADAVAGTGLEDEILAAFDEFEGRITPEARLARDADQLDLLFNLKEELDKGCTFARDWIDAALGRLKTEEGRTLARRMLEVDHNRWWFGRVDPHWWVERDSEAQDARASSDTDDGSKKDADSSRSGLGKLFKKLFG